MKVSWKRGQRGEEEKRETTVESPVKQESKGSLAGRNERIKVKVGRGRR